MSGFKTSNIKRFKLCKLYHFLELNLLKDGVFLAGGALRTIIDWKEKIEDFDLFFSSMENLEQVRDRISSLDGSSLIFSCPENKLISFLVPRIGKIQLIGEFFHQSGFSVIDSFDFNACSAAFDGESVFFKKEFVHDVRTKTLSLNKLSYPVASLKRVFKYKEKGYSINNILKDIVIELSRGEVGEDELRVYID